MFRTPFRLGLPRYAAIPAAIGTLLASAAFTYPGGLASAYDDLGDYDGHRRQMADSRIADMHSDAVFANLTDRIALKEQMMDELISGRATLRETTRGFMEINAGNETTRTVIGQQYCGSTYEEKSARNVIDFAVNRLRHSPSPSNTYQRLEGQFREMFGREISGK